MSDFLRQMAASSAARAVVAKVTWTESDLDKPAHKLRLGEFDLIAEIKDRSPAEGELAASSGPRAERARMYAKAGAAAISVLTEPDRFDGQLAHLEEVVRAVAAEKTPVMRKDFLVDTVQIQEAKAAGASGVLLIIAMLPDERVRSLLDCAFDHDLFVLLESFDEDDWQRSLQLLEVNRYREKVTCNQFLLGINTRDLRTLAVDPDRLERFGSMLPQGVTCVAESGQHSADDAARVAGWGYSASLVGTALMRAAEPDVLIRDMLLAGRAAS
ncbi:MAG: indole-3-glycerol phosphate synthase TrpC [Woeseiaceae bacterium]